MACSALATRMAFFGPNISAHVAPENRTGCEACQMTESFLVELAFVQEKRTLQTTVSSEYRSTRQGADVLMPVSLEYGISGSWQIGVDWSAWDYSRTDGEPVVRGVGQLGLNTKHTFAMTALRNHLASGFGLTIPTGKPGSYSIGYRPNVRAGFSDPSQYASI